MTVKKNNNVQFVSTERITYLKELNEIQLDCCLKVCKAPSLLILESPNSFKVENINNNYGQSIRPL